jgi:hypothetical protein
MVRLAISPCIKKRRKPMKLTTIGLAAALALSGGAALAQGNPATSGSTVGGQSAQQGTTTPGSASGGTTDPGNGAGATVGQTTARPDANVNPPMAGTRPMVPPATPQR